MSIRAIEPRTKYIEFTVNASAHLHRMKIDINARQSLVPGSVLVATQKGVHESVEDMPAGRK